MPYIKINKENYKHNLHYLANKAGSLEKVMAVLKDNAYGHGLEIIAKIVKEIGVKKVAVKNLQEAQKIASLFEEVLVLVEHPPSLMIEQNISIAVNSIDALKKILPKTSIHLNLDTGMHRNGFIPEEFEQVFKIIVENSLNVKGVYTHFRSADDTTGEFFFQEENYKKYTKQLKTLIQKYNLPLPSFHSCNSAALLRKGCIEDDYARCGISTYGYTHLDKSFGEHDLRPVLSLWAQKLSSRILKKGQKIGYGGTYEANADEVISTYDIGYGDGFFRFDGNEELVLSTDTTLIGRVSMDSLFIKGDKEEVCLFDDAWILAQEFNTITYDITTKLMPYIKRVVI